MSNFDSIEPDSAGIGLRTYLDVVWRRKWIVVGVTVLAIAVALLISLRQESIYRAESKIVIGQGNTLFQVQNGNSIQPFTATMADLFKSEIVARNVIQNLRLNYSTNQQLLNQVGVSINPQTAVMKVDVDDHDTQRAVQINQEMGNVFAQLVKERFGQGVAATPNTPAQPPITATIFDPAHILPGRVSPKRKQDLAIAGVLGLIVGLLGAFLREHFDRALRTRDAVESAFAAPVIGQIPFEKMTKRDERKVVWEGFGEVAEAYRALRANLQYLGVKKPLRTILVTSASAEQGKTTVAANLALAIARSGARPLVVECDLRRPRLSAAFGVTDDGPGLTSVLVGASELDGAIRAVPVPASRTAGGVEHAAEGISLMISGPLPPNPAELLSSMQMTSLLDRLSVSYDYVILDSPPLLPVADARELARMVDGVILVARRNRATGDEARELRSLLELLGIQLLGVVMTDVAAVGSYGYGYGPDDDRVKQRGPKPAQQQQQQAPPPPPAPQPVAAPQPRNSAADEEF